MAVGGARPMGLSRSTAMGHVPASLSKPARFFEVPPPPTAPAHIATAINRMQRVASQPAPGLSTGDTIANMCPYISSREYP